MTMSLFIRFPRYLASACHPRLYSHTLPSCGKAREKLAGIIEEYRLENYRQCVPTRFVKEILEAADQNKDGVVEIKEFLHLLKNIGAADKFSEAELTQAVAELKEETGLDGREGDELPVDELSKIMLKRIVENK